MTGLTNKGDTFHETFQIFDRAGACFLNNLDPITKLLNQSAVIVQRWTVVTHEFLRRARKAVRTHRNLDRQ